MPDDYDREIALLERQRRIRGESESFPVFAAPMSLVDEVIATGREDIAHPSAEDDPHPLIDDQDERCKSGLHEKTPGECQPCRSIRRKRTRGAESGSPLCWTATHPEPEEGHICPCGEPSPDPEFVDWAMVEDALAGRKLIRRMTNAEQVSTLRTIETRYHDVDGPFTARDVLAETGPYLSDSRVRYLVYDWSRHRNCPPI